MTLPANGWTQLRSGKLFYPLLEEPNFEDVTLSDIAHGISRQFRFGGHLADYTVAEHCHVLFFNVPEELRLAALFHDAIEGLGFPDVQLPFKNSPLLSGYKSLDHELTRKLFKFLGISDDHLLTLKVYDCKLASSEAQAFFQMELAEPHPNWLDWLKANPGLVPLKSQIRVLPMDVAKSWWLQLAASYSTPFQKGT
jgi:hypothetical protein